MKRALINIDYTYDFVAEKGALTCGKPGQEIEKELVSVTKQFIEKGDYVVFAIDKHEDNDVYHPEAKLFPPHNIAGTNGRDLFGELQDVYDKYKNAENVYLYGQNTLQCFCRNRSRNEAKRKRNRRSSSCRCMHRYLCSSYGSRCL